MMRVERLGLSLLLAGIAIGSVLLVLLLKAFGTEWLLVNEPLHATVEAVGGLAAIVMAILLMLKRHEQYGGKFFLLAMGFIAMGLLDILHSVALPGHGFVLLHTAASFIGGFWFALIWVPRCASERDAAWKSWTPWALVFVAILFGIWTFEARETLPIMVKDRTFTTGAVVFNVWSGVFFMAAATRLLIDYGRIGMLDIYLFACMATLFGLPGLMFPFSELWDNTWWFWHLLRLTSFVLALGFVIHEHQQTICGLRIALDNRKKAEEELRKHRDHLEEVVQERTAELREANEGLQQEITERNRAEEALRKTEERLEAIVDTSTNVICLKDTQGRYILVNREYETRFHVSRKQIQGMTDYDLFPGEMADAFRLNDLKVLEAKTPLELEEVVAQDDGIHIYLSNRFALLDSGGIPYAVCGISKDITERKRMEEQEVTERKRAESWLESLIHTTQDAVISIDRQGRIVLFNPAAERMFGYRSAEVQGRKVNILMLAPYASEHDGYISRYERTGEPRAIGRIRTVEARRKSGEVFPAELSLTEVASNESEEVRYAAFIRDMSEKTRLQEQLIENSRLAAIGVTAAKIAHEIGNPLNGMSLTAQCLERQLIRGESGSEEAVQSSLRSLREEIRRLSDLLQDLRSLSRREEYHFQPTTVAGVAGEVFSIEKENYTVRGVRVEQEFPGDLPLIRADRNKIKQALWNLSKNAVEAMPQGGTLTIRARRSGTGVVLEIGDTGIGVPPGVDIFEPFTTTKNSGSGLGLVVVRQIVAAHGGNLTYTSEPGKGTTFRLTLPHADESSI
ncbi:MAG: PAS domain S-box protein [Deltaproteobacteria bacterium]|nr:PAS domain S-box protein [Deltaproteobacteria bacterium]